MTAPSPMFVAFARWAMRRRARRQLDGIHVAGLDRVRARLSGGPLVMAANHVGWWDGPSMILVDEALGADGRVVVDAPSLRSFPFFRWLGAIPLDRSTPMAMRGAFTSARTALSGPGRTLWFFPQGRERPSWVRPLGFGRGHEVLGRHAPIVPVAISYAYRGGPCPAAFVHLGDVVPAAEVESAVVDGLAAIDRHLELGDGAFVTIVAGAVRRPEAEFGTRLLAGVSRA